MTNDEIIAVVTAAKAGKEIQYRLSGGAQEWAVAKTPSWAFEVFDYRVKPEPPKPREWWLLHTGGCYYGSQGVQGFHAYEDQGCTHEDKLRGIHVREVID